jgi:hypothetical protein
VSIPKHEPSKKTRGTKKVRALTLADMRQEAAFVDVTSVAEAIEGVGHIFSTWVSRQLAGDNAQPLYSQPTGYPVKVALTSLDGEDEATHTVMLELEGEIMHSIADSLKRIADAMTAKQEAK